MSQDRTKSEIQPRLFLGLVLATDTKTPSRTDFDAACQRIASTTTGLFPENVGYSVEDAGVTVAGDYFLSGLGQEGSAHVAYCPGPDIMPAVSDYAPGERPPSLWPEGCGHLMAEMALPLDNELQILQALISVEILAADCASVVGLPAPSVIDEEDLSNMEKGDISIIFWAEHGLCVIEMIPQVPIPAVIYAGCSLGWRRIYDVVAKEHTIENFARLAGIPTDMGTPDLWSEEQKKEAAMRFLGSGPEMHVLDT